MPVGAPKLILPAISPESSQDFFRSRCLRRDVEMAGEHDPRELFDIMQSAEPVDWFVVWRDLTKEGEHFTANLEKVAGVLKPYGDAVKVAFFQSLHQTVWPPETSE